MPTAIDLVQLRALVIDVAVQISRSNTHRTMPDAFAQAGLPDPVEEGTKTERAELTVAAIADEDLPGVAADLLVRRVPQPGTRNALQDVLWAAESVPVVPARTRREIAGDLDLDEYRPHFDLFKALLNNVWILGEDPFLVMFGDEALDWSLGGRSRDTSGVIPATGAPRICSRSSASGRPLTSG